MEKIPIPVSLLELALITQGSNVRDTLQKTSDIAQKADELDYKRLWFAEHHNMPHIASAATVVLISYYAQKTKKIRIGSGGIMLPNHSPLVVAEQFGTLDALFPRRIDLGLGRAPGTDPVTAQALNKNFFQAAQQFPQHVAELQQYFSPENSSFPVRSFSSESASVPFWILGSSTESAKLAARYGLPYAFASHFAPNQLLEALAIYRHHFQPSAHLSKPYAMVCANVIISDTEQEAQKQATAMYQMFLDMLHDNRRPIQAPLESMEGIWSAREEAYIRNMLSRTFIGTAKQVQKDLIEFQKLVHADELMITLPIYSHSLRLKVLELARTLFI